jgi:hypothetical protein
VRNEGGWVYPIEDGHGIRGDYASAGEHIDDMLTAARDIVKAEGWRIPLDRERRESEPGDRPEENARQRGAGRVPPVSPVWVDVERPVGSDVVRHSTGYPALGPEGYAMGQIPHPPDYYDIGLEAMDGTTQGIVVGQFLPGMAKEEINRTIVLDASQEIQLPCDSLLCLRTAAHTEAAGKHVTDVAALLEGLDCLTAAQPHSTQVMRRIEARDEENTHSHPFSTAARGRHCGRTLRNAATTRFPAQTLSMRRTTLPSLRRAG